jgi:tetratricopeptide (TPR) repeat protein
MPIPTTDRFRPAPWIAAAAVIACLSNAGCGKDATTPAATTEKAAEAGEPEPPPPPPLTQEQLEELYVSAKARIEAVANLPEESRAEIEANLSRVANEAEDAHLRANASLLLGSMSEARNDTRTAISFYRQAAELVPDDADTHIVLALALAKAEKWDEAIQEQFRVVELIPDDLVGWLLLGELHVKGGKLDQAILVYGGYELRRKGLLDGLTLKQDGKYLKEEGERAACAQALAPAVDNGTALALMYAFDSDPSPMVRTAIAEVMGEQRLVGYQKLLKDKLPSEADAEAKKAIEWALAEIEREGEETSPGPVPESIAKQVEAEAKALAEKEAQKEADKQAETKTQPEGGTSPKPAEGPG